MSFLLLLLVVGRDAEILCACFVKCNFFLKNKKASRWR